jgi:hypothetical protein
VKENKQIISIGLDRLVGHEGNPNRMSNTVFSKLRSHIERTGNYEPIIVRAHPEGGQKFEILNGHHRIRALRELGYKEADCVVWQVDDEEALILLATLNRLGGSDDIGKKSALIKNLCRKYQARELSRMLADGTRTIQRLKGMEVEQRKSFSKAFLNPMVFFLTDEQKGIVDKALASAVEGEGVVGSAQKRAGALVKIAEVFLNGEMK